MSYFLYLAGLLPSLIWLSFYLRKDSHPEPNRMVLKIFFCGILVGLPAILLEKAFEFLIKPLPVSYFVSSLLIIFLGGAFVEEYLKYLVVKVGVFKSAALDEPLDLMLYLIISALGFAALENVLILTNYHPTLDLGKTTEIMVWRLVSATILHALCSALVGYFLVLAFYRLKNLPFAFWGITIAAFLHGSYNLSIMEIKGLERFILPLIILITLFFFVSSAFKKAKKMRSVCLLKEKE